MTRPNPTTVGVGVEVDRVPVQLDDDDPHYHLVDSETPSMPQMSLCYASIARLSRTDKNTLGALKGAFWRYIG